MNNQYFTWEELRKNRPYDCAPNYLPREFNELTKIKGPTKRHIEQLWDEIKKLKARVKELEEMK